MSGDQESRRVGLGAIGFHARDLVLGATGDALDPGAGGDRELDLGEDQIDAVPRQGGPPPGAIELGSRVRQAPRRRREPHPLIVEGRPRFPVPDDEDTGERHGQGRQDHDQHARARQAARGRERVDGGHKLAPADSQVPSMPARVASSPAMSPTAAWFRPSTTPRTQRSRPLQLILPFRQVGARRRELGA